MLISIIVCIVTLLGFGVTVGVGIWRLGVFEGKLQGILENIDGGINDIHDMLKDHELRIRTLEHEKKE